MAPRLLAFHPTFVGRRGKGALPATATHRMNNPENEFRDLLGIAFECFPMGAAVLGLDGSFLHVNPALCTQLGRPADELQRHTIYDFIGPDEKEAVTDQASRILDGGVDHYREQRVLMRPDGSRIRLDVTGVVLKSAAGRPRAILVVGTELPDPGPAPSQRPLPSDTAKSTPAPDGVVQPTAGGPDGASLRDEFEAFCRTVSQEFRIPLRIIEGYSAIVVEDSGEDLDATSLRHLNTIRDQSRRLSAMIDNTLALARIGSRPLRPERVDLSALALDVAAVVRAEAHARDVEVRIQEGLVAEVDANLAGRLLRRLFENAFRFARASSTPRIEFDVTQGQGPPAFFVRDNGSGFDMTFAHKLFEPFETLHAGSEAAGSGVGLAEVQRIVSRHGGRVWAEGSPGRGATFYFTLAAADPAASSSAPKL